MCNNTKAWEDKESKKNSNIGGLAGREWVKMMQLHFIKF